MFAFLHVILSLALAGAPDSSQLLPTRHEATHGGHAHPADAAEVLPNDNRRPAGTLAAGVLTLELRAATGAWRPEGADKPAFDVQAFGEPGAPLVSPAPLIRVPEGTTIRIGVRNELTSPLRVSGLCEHGSATCPPLEVPPGERREVAFKAGVPGTYQYWATSMGAPLAFRAVGDTQLSGAFVVDPAGAAVNDRVLVITDWTGLTLDQLHQVLATDDPGQEFLRIKPRVLFAINGRAWPNTERLTYSLGDDVRWRVVNLSTQAHPMHLHGFYFDVDAIGDGVRDKPLPAGHSRVFTQLMPPGSTMAMTWRPERAGN